MFGKVKWNTFFPSSLATQVPYVWRLDKYLGHMKIHFKSGKAPTCGLVSVGRR